MLPLYEQYRPKTFGEVVGQEKALAQINVLRKRGLSGRAYWLTGASGTGKTTIAHLLAAEIADKEMIEEIDAKHYGDKKSECTYCYAIKQAEKLLKKVR